MSLLQNIIISYVDETLTPTIKNEWKVVEVKLKIKLFLKTEISSSLMTSLFTFHRLTTILFFEAIFH